MLAKIRDRILGWVVLALLLQIVVGTIVYVSDPGMSPAQSVLDWPRVGVQRIGEVTSLEQRWGMFTPNLPTHACLPVVLLPDGTVLRSEFEPADLDRHFRLPGANTRRFNAESGLTLVGYLWTPEYFARFPEPFRDSFASFVRKHGAAIRTFCRRRVHESGHPLPAEVTFGIRLLPLLPVHPGGVRGPDDGILPVAHWHSAESALEAWNPIRQQFEPLKP